MDYLCVSVYVENINTYFPLSSYIILLLYFYYSNCYYPAKLRMQGL